MSKKYVKNILFSWK